MAIRKIQELLQCPVDVLGASVHQGQVRILPLARMCVTLSQIWEVRLSVAIFRP